MLPSYRDALEQPTSYDGSLYIKMAARPAAA